MGNIYFDTIVFILIFLLSSSFTKEGILSSLSWKNKSRGSLGFSKNDRVGKIKIWCALLSTGFPWRIRSDVGEDDLGIKGAKDPYSFGNRPLWARIFTVCAGVLMNFFLGGFFNSGIHDWNETDPLTPEDADRAIAEGTVITDDAGVISGIVPVLPQKKQNYFREILLWG